LVVGKAKNLKKKLSSWAGMSVIGDISDLLSRGSKVRLNFDEEEEEEEKYNHQLTVFPIFSIPLEKYDKFVVKSSLYTER
jgi:hypothetical protein